jgi:UDP:flavonoid glycosyltransferase YjiC (YdhE family)
MTVVVFAAPWGGHFWPVRQLVGDLAAAGADVVVFTAPAFADSVRSAGARFADLYGRYPIEAADDASKPIPSRSVAHAARFAEPVLREARALRPTLVVYETFCLIGRVVALALGAPAVNVSAVHNLNAAEFHANFAVDARVDTSPACLRAVDELRDHWGIEDATPFSYVDAGRPLLNVLCEPAAWLTDEERAVFAPARHVGPLPALADIEGRRDPARPSLFGEAEERVHVSLGTVPWWYWPELAVGVLDAVSEAVAERPGAQAVLSLGGADVPAADVARLRRRGVQVTAWADTWLALRDATVTVTACGLSSTHEAVMSRVPMIAYPFHGDQPALARRAEELGVAYGFGTDLREPPTAAQAHGALDAAVERRAQLDAALRVARAAEIEAIEQRPVVAAEMLALADQA